MKTLRLSLALALALAAATAAATDVKFDLNPPYFNCSPAAGRVVKVQPLTPFVGNLVSYTSDTSGIFYVTNMPVGDHAVTVTPKGAAGQVAFQVTVTATNLGLVRADEHTSQLGVQTYPTAGKSSWTISAADRRYAPNGTNDPAAGQVLSYAGGGKGLWIDAGSGGSATNVNFHAGQSTSWRKSGGSNVVDVVGTLTNNTTGLAGGLTAGASLTNAQLVTSSAAPDHQVLARTLDSGLTLTLDADADPGWHFTGDTYVTGGSLRGDLLGTLTGVTMVRDNVDTNLIESVSGGSPIAVYSVANDGVVFPRSVGGNGQYLSNLPPTAIVGVVTNVAVPVFNSVAEMISAGLSNDVVEVVGYWGSTNTWGGGRFRLRTGVTLSTNFGTIFTNRTGSTGTAGYRERVRDATNYYRLDWFGVRPMNTDATATIHDSYQRVTNCIEVAGNFCDIVFPPYGFAVSQTIVVSNKVGFVWRGAGNGSSRTTYPEKASWIAYVGTSTSVPLVKLIDSQRARIEDIGFETSTPTYSGGGNYVTNNALVGLDIDQSGSSWPQITTGIRVNRCYFRSRGTNVTWVGVRISETSTSNCEDIRLFDCGFAGGGYWDGSTGVLSTANDPVAIKVGNSANARGLVFDTITWTDCKHGVYALSGGWMIRNVLCTGSLADFYIHSAVGPIDIDGVQSEEQKMAVWIDSFGVGVAGADIVPVSIRNSHFHYSPTGWRTPSLALIPVQSQAKLLIQNSVFSGVANQRVFDPTNTVPVSVTSWGNTYPTNDLGVVGITNLTYGVGDEYMRDGNGNYSRGWRVIGQYYQDAVISNGTNFSRMRVHGQGLNLNESNGVVRIGPVNTAGVDADPNLSVWSRKNSVSFTMGDTNIGNRLQLHNNGNQNQTEMDLIAATNREARLRLIEKTGGYNLDLFAGFSKAGLMWTNGQFQVLMGDSVMSAWSASAMTFQPSNNNFSIVSTQINLNGSLTLTGFFNWRTNMPSDWPAAPANRGQSALVNSNGTLYALLSGANGAAWAETNAVAPNAAQIVQEFTGTPTGSKFLRDDGTLAVPAGGGSQTPWASDIDGANYSLTGALGVRVKSGGIGTAAAGGNLSLYANGDRVGMFMTGGTQPNIRLGPDSDYFTTSTGGNGIFAGDSNTNRAAFQSVILGGGGGVIDTGSTGSAIVGGGQNVVSGNYAASVGGRYNWVSNNAVAIGPNAKATNTGSVVISAQQESTSVAVNTLSNQQMILYAPGGVTVNTNQGTTNAFFVLGSATVTSNLTAGGQVTGAHVGDGTLVTNVVGVKFPTNTTGTVVAFAFTNDIVRRELTTNATFQFLAPVNVSTTNYQSVSVWVTNSSASTINVIAPANVYTNGGGVWNVTNGGMTVFSFYNFHGNLTNALAFPIK